MVLRTPGLRGAGKEEEGEEGTGQLGGERRGRGRKSQAGWTRLLPSPPKSDGLSILGISSPPHLIRS